VSFLMTLRGNDLQPAINASRQLTRMNQPAAPSTGPQLPATPPAGQKP
jgi:hypothetical protein